MKKSTKTISQKRFNTIRINSRRIKTAAAIHWKIFGFGITTLIISNEKMNNIIKIVKSFVKSGLLIKNLREKIKNEAK